MHIAPNITTTIYFKIRSRLSLHVLRTWGYFLCTILHSRAIQSIRDEGGTWERLCHEGLYAISESDTTEKSDNRLLNRVHRFITHACMEKSSERNLQYGNVIYWL